MSRLSRVTRRAGAVAATTLALAVLPAGGLAYAATGTVTHSSPAFVANTGSATRVVFTLSEAPTSPAEVLEVSLTGPAGNTVADTGTPAVEGETVEATFDLRGAAPGVYAVRVADPTGAVDEFECASCLQVLATPPTVSSVTPSRRGASSAAALFTVTGTNLFQGISVKFLREGAADPTIAYPATGSLSVGADNRTVSGQLAIAANAVPGPRDVEVTNTDGQRATCGGCLTVTPAPSYVSLSPNVAGQGAMARALTLTGADFHPAMSAAFYAPGSTTDRGGVTVTSFSVEENQLARATINVADSGDTVNVQRDLVLTNPDGGRTRIANVLTLTPEPRVTSLSPATLDGGATREQVVVTGTGLGADPHFSFSGAGVIVNGYTPDAATAATRGILDLSIAEGAATGGRTVTVTNLDGGRSTSGTVLTVGTTPVISKVSPSALGRGAANRKVTITGSGFDTGGVEVTIPGVTVSAANAISAGTIEATVSVPGTAEIGVRDVSVLNTAAGRRGRTTCGGCFAVDTFAVDSVTPSAVLNSATYQLDVYGAELPAGEMTATLTRSVARAGQEPIVFDGVVNDARTRFTGTVDLRDMAPGSYTLRLAQGDAVGTCTCTFSIVAERAPSVTSVSPSSAAQGARGVELTIKGAGYSRGADVRFGNGVTKAGAVTFVDSTTLRVPVDVSPEAAAGAVSVTVLIPSFSSSDTEGTCATCFTVSKSPTVTSSSRSARGQGAAPVPVTLTGTEFQPGATVSVGNGVTVSDVVRVSATTITFTAAVAEDATPGPRTITVTNPDGGTGSCECFAVTPRPATTSVAPTNGAQGRSGVPVTLHGTGYQPGVAVSFGPDIVVSNVTGSGDSLNATLDLTNATTGAHDVTVTNADGGQATCACAFHVYVPPTISGLTPASRGAGSIGEVVTIMGTNFTESATVAFADPGITVTAMEIVDKYRIDATVTIARDVSPGMRSVTVTNLDNGQSASCASCFSVNAAPTVSSTSVTAPRGAEDVVVSFSGSGFQPGAVGVNMGDGVTVTDARALSASSVQVTFDVSPSAELGDRDIAFVNGDGGRATCGSCLSVTAPAPAAIATSIPDFRVSPTRVVAGQYVTMRGTLRDADAKGLSGQTVRVYVTGGGFSSWVLWKTATTAGDGTFATTGRMTRTRTIKAVFLPPTETYTRADSGSVTVPVATKITVTSPKSGTRVGAGKTFTVRGTTYPAKPGTKVYLFWRKTDGSYSMIRSGTVASNGTFALSRSLRKGTYRLRVGVPAAAGNASGRSAYFTLYVV